jgi:hypothetical protein
MDKKYKKSTPRISVKFIDSKTNNVLFEIHDRNWMNVGELFTDQYVDELIKQTIKKENLPENIIVLVVSDYALK